jgi:hypothetical protein
MVAANPKPASFPSATILARPMLAHETSQPVSSPARRLHRELDEALTDTRWSARRMIGTAAIASLVLWGLLISGGIALAGALI